MRLLRAPTALLSLVASAHLSQAAVAFYTKNTQVTVSVQLEDTSDHDLQSGTLAKRGGGQGGGGSGCNKPCGFYSQLCCGDQEQCYTNANNQPTCTVAGAVVATTTVAAATGAGSWQYYTSTWVDTVTQTSIWSSWVPAVTAVAATCSPNTAIGETGCGSICCAGSQYCYQTGTCRAINGYTTEGVSASAPARGTSVTGVIITATISPTTTVPFSTPVSTGAAGANGTVVATGGHGLSGGAIAGIVIGTIAGVILLLLICLACCLKAGFDSLLALFGIGRRRGSSRRSHVIEEEIIEHRRHGSAAASAEGRRWHGSGYDRPSRPPPSSRRSSPRKTGGFGGLGAMTAGLGGLALALGLKRRADKRRREDEKSSTGSYSYYDSSYYDSSSK
jgi:hypothetical protein